MNTAPATQPVFVNTPCHENYDKMIPASGGKFCESCRHVVIDFTGWKQEDIVLYLKSRGSEQVCGRLRNSQAASAQPENRWLFSLKISVLTAIALLFAKPEAKAQSKPTEDVAPQPNVYSDSVVLIVRGEVKSNNHPVSNAKVIAINADGDTIAGSDVVDGKFEMRVPVAFPKEAFTIVASAPQYKVFTLKNYVSSAGNVIGIDMERLRKKRNLRHPFRKHHYATVGCVSF